MVERGDVIEVATRKVGQAPRRGTVKAVRGALITVTWDSGEETSLIPAAGSLTVVGRSGSGKPKTSATESAAKKTKIKKPAGKTPKAKAGAKSSKRRR